MEDIFRYLWVIFSLSVVNTVVSLVIFGCGLVVAVAHPQSFVRQAHRHNPGSPMWVRSALIWLFVVWLVLTIIGCVWLISAALAGELKTWLHLATVTSVVQGFVYGTAGIVIGLLGLRQ